MSTNKVVGWDKVGKSFGLILNVACPISLLKFPFKLYIIYLLQHWIPRDDWHILEPVGTTLVRSLPAMPALTDEDVPPASQTPKQSLSTFSPRPQFPRSRSRSLPGRALPQLETKGGLQEAALTAEAPLSAGEIAFATLQYLPIPIIVLSSLKQVILVNEALKSLLATVDAEEDVAVSNGAFVQTAGAETLLGRSLSQIGIEMVTEGNQAGTSLEVLRNDTDPYRYHLS